MIVRFSARAARDLSIIFDYGYEEFGEEEADEFARDLERRILVLADQPEIGRRSGSQAGTIRRAVLKPFNVEYRIVDDVVEVIRIVHHRADR